MGSKTVKAARFTRNADNGYNTTAANWALIRHSNNANPFTKKYGTSDLNEHDDYTFTYDDNHGEGQDVDIVCVLGKMPDISNDAYKTNGVSRIVQYDWSSLADNIGGLADYRPGTIKLDDVNTTPRLRVFIYGITTPAGVFSVGDTFTISGAPTSEFTVGDNTWLPSGAPDINGTSVSVRGVSL